MDISNWLTLAGVIISLMGHLAIISSKISRFMGVTEQCITDQSRRITAIEENHQKCQVRIRVDTIEEKQGELRNEDLPEMKERLARIEQELIDIKRRLDDIKNDMNRSGRKDRVADR